MNALELCSNEYLMKRQSKFLNPQLEKYVFKIAGKKIAGKAAKKSDS
jgi:hypothetical protein